MATYNIPAGITSSAIKIDRESIISVSASDAVVQYTAEAYSAIQNNVATWTTMTLSGSAAYITDDIHVKIISTSACVLTVDSSPSTEKLKQYRPDYRTSALATGGASGVTYSNTVSALASTTVQAAIDEVAAEQTVLAASIAAGVLFGPVVLTTDISGVLPLANGGSSIVVLPGAVNSIGTTYADVTGLSFAVAASATYFFEFFMSCVTDAITTGYDVAVNGPASPTAINYVQEFYTSTTGFIRRYATAYDTDTFSTDSNGASTRVARVAGVFQNGTTAGTLIARAKRENVGSGFNIATGFGLIRRVA